jgi:hypothetical protein
VASLSSFFSGFRDSDVMIEMNDVAGLHVGSLHLFDDRPRAQKQTKGARRRHSKKGCVSF